MNTRTLGIVITSLALGPFAIGASTTNPPAPAATATQQISQAKAPGEAEPTEAEMRDAVQRHLDSLNSQTPQPPRAVQASGFHSQSTVSRSTTFGSCQPRSGGNRRAALNLRS